MLPEEGSAILWRQLEVLLPDENLKRATRLELIVVVDWCEARVVREKTTHTHTVKCVREFVCHLLTARCEL